MEGKTSEVKTGNEQQIFQIISTPEKSVALRMLVCGGTAETSTIFSEVLIRMYQSEMIDDLIVKLQEAKNIVWVQAQTS